MTEVTHDFTGLAVGQFVEDAFPGVIVALQTYSQGRFRGSDPAGWISRNAVNAGNKGQCYDDTFVYPDGDYRVSLDYQVSTNQGYRDSYGVATRMQANGACYMVIWGGNTDGFIICRTSGGQYSAITELRTELAENGSISANPETRQWMGIRATGTGAVVTIEAFNTLNGAALFSYDDSTVDRIVADGKGGWEKGNGPSDNDVGRIFALNINDGVSGSNIGLRLRAKSDAALTINYPNTTGIDVAVYNNHGGTELLQTTGAVVSGVLEIDNDALGALGNDVWVTGEKNGEYVFAQKALVVDLSNSSNYSD